ncbi:MAG: ATP-binding cassette domain-containing protein [Actinomycetota bacterium]|nr:ATP-binding cassette domain-containing protein [Actinomycetota bacterium]|tara:strand:- start:10367 stop:11080 length:714 start_codon:yes stop_codon:yes gene_type:complete
MIQIESLTMLYKNNKGVKDINISLEDGEVKALLGPNGSGKSTTMRSFMGFLKPSEGTLSVNGIDTLDNPVEAKKIIGYLPGDPQLPQNLNSKTLFKLGAQMRDSSIDYAMELSEKFELDVKQIVKELSKGNRQKTAVILALLHKPKALILDEPTSGLDPFHQRTFFETIEEFSNNGVSVLLSSHIISEVEKIADSMAVLKVGSKIYDESYKTFEKQAKEDGKELEDAFFEFYDREVE